MTSQQRSCFASEMYMESAKPYRIFCLKCGVPMVEWFEEGVKPTGEYFCGCCGYCVHNDGTNHQLPRNIEVSNN